MMNKKGIILEMDMDSAALVHRNNNIICTDIAAVISKSQTKVS